MAFLKQSGTVTSVFINLTGQNLLQLQQKGLSWHLPPSVHKLTFQLGLGMETRQLLKQKRPFKQIYKAYSDTVVSTHNV